MLHSVLKAELLRYSSCVHHQARYMKCASDIIFHPVNLVFFVFVSSFSLGPLGNNCSKFFFKSMVTFSCPFCFPTYGMIICLKLCVKAVDFVLLWGVKVCTSGRHGRGRMSYWLSLCFWLTKVASLMLYLSIRCSNEAETRPQLSLFAIKPPSLK